MLNFPSGTKNEQKCNVTHGVMGHLDPKQPPVKRKPFAAILSQSFIQKTELILPEELYDIIKKDVVTDLSKPVYSRVILPLGALLEGEFFNEYIKRGNVLMLSEGKSDIDNVYSLREGVLTLHLDKASYERAGIIGKPDGVKGKRGTKPRWVVEIKLRLPSMLHEKKGFDRIVYAFKNVLSTPVTWLFVDLAKNTPSPNPMDAHLPITKTISPEVQKLEVTTPSLKPPTDPDDSYSGDFEDYAVETQEWLSLILLNSPRVDPNDKIDPYLSRYVVPRDTHTSSKLVRITWRGFLSPTWAHKMFVQMLLAAPKNGWFAYCVDGFGEGSPGYGKHCTILKLPDAQNEYVSWEIA
ncbi:ribonuclease P 40kDa subunit [Cadophora sp. DSE1049]|nr:ribonuclease P 40kDa subunit [Cadophora sp. DSE1049]